MTGAVNYTFGPESQPDKYRFGESEGLFEGDRALRLGPTARKVLALLIKGVGRKIPAGRLRRQFTARDGWETTDGLPRNMLGKFETRFRQ
jgi:hypothetical protein